MNSELINKESVLSLLLVDAKVKIAKGCEDEVVSLDTIFNKEMELKPGEFHLQIMIDTTYIDLPYVSLKRATISKVGYPVVSVAAIVKDNRIRVVFSGVCGYPFRSVKIETILNDTTLPVYERIEKVAAHLPSEIVDDIQASGKYRAFVLKNVLLDTMSELEMVT